MLFKHFEIRNFKGIKSARLDLIPSGASVFTLIGLNESGKTTVLSALDVFSLNNEKVEALYGSTTKAEAATFVPKHSKANFTGLIEVRAFVAFEPGEMDAICDEVEAQHKAKINRDAIPDTFYIDRGYRFESSDYKAFRYFWSFSLEGKLKGDRKVKPLPWTEDVGKVFTASVARRLPKIVYFPTFLFEIPDRIILNPELNSETDVNKLYRQIIQDVASSLPEPLNVQKHLVSRIINPETPAEKVVGLWFLDTNRQQQIHATLNALSAHLTKTVRESWGKIFSGDFGGRELLLRLGVDNDSGTSQVYLSFILKDGATEYEVAERSLGFRWFFSFLLFTLYRVYAKGRGPTLFLLDEPASNLHSRAQTQLLESFARIATGGNLVMYSTHSHYMINPDWLDQAFVISNRAVDYAQGDEAKADIGAGHTDIEVERYRAFVAKHPTRTTYFQPVLDKLDAVPSRLDLLRPSILVEGKGDFFILEYGRRVLLKGKSDMAVVPTRGAAGMDELIGLFLGWGVRFVICLDDDKAGKKAQARYINEWGLTSESVFTLGDVDPSLQGKKIEDLLSPEDMQLVKTRLGTANDPSKSQVQLFFSEALSRKENLKLSSAFRSRIEAFEKLSQGRLKPAS